MNDVIEVGKAQEVILGSKLVGAIDDSLPREQPENDLDD